jgi:hypothetical protein
LGRWGRSFGGVLGGSGSEERKGAQHHHKEWELSFHE